MVTDKLYCVDLLGKLGTVAWLVTQSIPQTRLFRVVYISCKCSLSYFCIFIKNPKSFIKWKQVFHDHFFTWFICGSNVLWRYCVSQKNFPVIEKFFSKENIWFSSNVNFTSKILISGLLIKLHNFQWIKNWQLNCLQSQLPSTNIWKNLLRIKK